MKVLYFAALVSVALAAPLELGDKLATKQVTTFTSSSAPVAGAWVSEDARLGRKLVDDAEAWKAAGLGAEKVTKFTKIEEGVPAWDSRLMASGRSAWGADEKLMASGRSWDAKSARIGMDGKMLAVGRSAWDSNAAHLYKDAHPMIEILQQQYEMAPQPGSYVYSYKTANGIEAQEQAALKAEDAEAVQGTYSWVAPNGEKFAVEYVADETGYHARGAHIPEMPVAIARSLEWNAAHPEEDDRSWESAEAASTWANRAKLAAGRSAWDSKILESDAKFAAGRPAAWDSKILASDAKFAAGRSAWDSKILESDAKFAAVRPAAWDSKILTSDAKFAAGRSAWDSKILESDAKLDGVSQFTKITKTSTLGAEPTLFATGRSAWSSEAAVPLAGATKITKITKTSTIGGPSAFSGLQLNADAKLVDDSHAAWEAHQAPRLGFGRSTVTKVVEHGPVLSADHAFKL